MPATMLNAPTIVSAHNGATPPIRVSRGVFSDGERIVIRQGAMFVSISDGDLVRLLTALQAV